MNSYRKIFAIALPTKTILIVSLTLALPGLTACELTSGPQKAVQPTQIVFTETPPAPFKLHIPDKALWRNYLSVSAETTPGTTCRLTYVPPMGTTQEMDTVADESGLCQWRWKISEEEGKGPARLIFTINGTSETHFIEVRRSF